MNFSELKGWAKHRTFGLRAEWMALFLNHPNDWWKVGNLGSKQVESLNEWLKTIGLRKAGFFQTSLLRVWNELGPCDLRIWSLTWSNIVHSWPVARLYVIRNYRSQMTTKAMVSDFALYVTNVAERTLYDGILELFGLFQNTPIGVSLGQGLVEVGACRTVIRKGDAMPPAASLANAMLNLFIEQGCISLDANQDLVWPWTVYGCEREYAISQLIMNASDWLEISSERIICRDINKGASNVMGLLGLH